MEKAYLTMKNSGASSITLGIIVLVVGVATGILAIVNGAKLLKHKKRLHFEQLDSFQGNCERTRMKER